MTLGLKSFDQWVNVAEVINGVGVADAELTAVAAVFAGFLIRVVGSIEPIDNAHRRQVVGHAGLPLGHDGKVGKNLIIFAAHILTRLVASGNIGKDLPGRLVNHHATLVNGH